MPFVLPKRIEPQPFLKWAGGKASLLRQLEEFFPHEIDRYLEPFLGGGAVFFHLKHRFPDMRAFLRDSNKELINCFRVVRDRPKELMEFLDEHIRRFRANGDDHFLEKIHWHRHLSAIPTPVFISMKKTALFLTTCGQTFANLNHHSKHLSL